MRICPKYLGLQLIQAAFRTGQKDRPDTDSYAHRCSYPASECDKSVSCKHFLITHLFVFYKKDLVCEMNVFKGQKKVSERKTKGL